MTIFLLIILLLLSACFGYLRYIKFSVTLFLIAMASFIFIGGGFFPQLLLTHLQKNVIPLDKPTWQKKNAIILLGVGTLHLPNKDTLRPTVVGYSRIYETARLYFSCKKSATKCLVIVSGGDALSVGESEAVIYQKTLMDLGVANSDFILESKSMNTYQNAKFTSALLQKQSFNQIVLVTSAIHMERALLYFSAFDVKPTPAPADYLTAIHSFPPLGYNFAMTDFALHEYIGVVRFHLYQFMGWNIGNTKSGQL
jgi:uncharacterized SAM-binding protein YcdF (DUF218 family)